MHSAKRVLPPIFRFLKTCKKQASGKWTVHQKNPAELNKEHEYN